ncbi:protein kinase domain-containing protein [Pendulispora albinea]|uniref:Serine/threonine protein kinase n=1 Tax=Pendulispora albinea TaxID=2741071 RepID=A0ABZ2M5P6_9BACT
MRICPRCSELFQDDAGFCPLDGSPLTKSNDPLLGRTIAGRFRLIKRLGAGGMSSVYLARHVMIERLNAIKILRQELSLNPSHRERFLREARAVNRINHHNIVEITDFGDSDNLAYLVMEYIEGESLITHMRVGRFPWRRAAHIAAQVASALGRAHQMGIIHRDLKPENIMLVTRPDAPDTVKLTDFGIAKILDAPALTFHEQMFGTPGYIAPEYLEGLAPDGRADLYALGVVMYEMLAGTLPYDARGQSELLFSPLKSNPVPLRERGVDIPPDIELLVHALLAKRRDDRPADAFSVHDALLAAIRRPIASITEDEETVTAHLDAAAMDAAIRDSEVTPLAIDAAIASMAARDDALPDEPLPGAAAIAEPPPSLRTPPAHDPRSTHATHTSDAPDAPDAKALTAPWVEAVEELERAIERTRTAHDGPADRAEREERARRAAEEVDGIRDLIASVERASVRAADYQRRVDRLAAKGREFRSEIGRAIDDLSQQRARERMHLASIRARRQELEELLLRHAQKEQTDDEPPPEATWEEEPLRAADERSVAIDADLTSRLELRKRQLEEQNEQLDLEFSEATGLLEGAISAVRRLTRELVQALDDAAALVTFDREKR